MTDKREVIANILAPYIDWGSQDTQKIELARNLVDSILEVLGERDGDEDDHDVLCGSALVRIDGRYEDACTCEVIKVTRDDERRTILWGDDVVRRWYSHGRREAAGAVRQALISTGFSNDVSELLVAAARGDSA